MDQKQSNIGNCPHCTKVIFKNGAFKAEASFTMRCPSCQKLLEIEIKIKIEIVIKPAERYLSEKNLKLGKLPVFFGFFNQLPMVAHCLLCFPYIHECINALAQHC